MNILVAEDSGVIRHIVQRAVEQLGHECFPARDGAEAWELFQRVPMDVIISDWMMPNMDGPELCRRVREYPRSYTYFVFLTAIGGDAEHAFAVLGMQMGADDYLTKPLNFHELAVRLIAAERITSLHRRLLEQNDTLQRMNETLDWMNQRPFESATTDPLTQLGNRQRLLADLPDLLARAERHGHAYALVRCGLDGFEQYAAVHGRLAVERALGDVSQTLLAGCRAADTPYRYDESEFVLVMPDRSAETAAEAAIALLASIQRLSIPYPDNLPAAVLTLSAGTAGVAPGTQATPEGLLDAAGRALAQAQSNGGNRVALHAEGRSALPAVG